LLETDPTQTERDRREDQVHHAEGEDEASTLA
jgi:hypothetical protein